MPHHNIPQWKRDNIEQSRKELLRKLEHAKKQESDRAIMELVKRYEEKTGNLISNPTE